MKYNENVLPERVADKMREHNTTQIKLADVIGQTQQQVSQRLLGHTRFTVADLAAIANYYSCTPGELLADDVLFMEGL